MAEPFDDDAPELTAELLARARPAREVLTPAQQASFKRSGRPKAETTKVLVSLRLDPDVLEYFRATGPGWQSRINETLARQARGG